MTSPRPSTLHARMLIALVGTSLLLHNAHASWLSSDKDEVNKDVAVSRPHSFSPPLPSGVGSVPFFKHDGSSVITDDYIRLTPQQASSDGSLWNTDPILAADWQVELAFRVSGARYLGGDGMAFWYTKNMGPKGSTFGNADDFTGLGIMFDTYDNDGRRDNPSISAIVSDGSMRYDHQGDGKATRIDGAFCRVNYRNSREPAKVLVTYKGSEKTLTVSYDIKNNGYMQPCFTVKDVTLPEGYYFGVTAHTGEVADNHDIHGMQTRLLSEEHVTEELEGGTEEEDVDILDSVARTIEKFDALSEDEKHVKRQEHISKMKDNDHDGTQDVEEGEEEHDDHENDDADHHEEDAEHQIPPREGFKGKKTKVNRRDAYNRKSGTDDHFEDDHHEEEEHHDDDHAEPVTPHASGADVSEILTMLKNMDRRLNGLEKMVKEVKSTVGTLKSTGAASAGSGNKAATKQDAAGMQNVQTLTELHNTNTKKVLGAVHELEGVVRNQGGAGRVMQEMSSKMTLVANDVHKLQSSVSNLHDSHSRGVDHIKSTVHNISSKVESSGFGWLSITLMLFAIAGVAGIVMFVSKKNSPKRGYLD